MLSGELQDPLTQALRSPAIRGSMVEEERKGKEKEAEEADKEEEEEFAYEGRYLAAISQKTMC